jgi:hypothetical protein
MREKLLFLDTEFTDLLNPELLSMGLVTHDGRLEFYTELDLNSDTGKARVAASSDFVRYNGVLDLWGIVPGTTCTEAEMGRRAGEWLLMVAADTDSKLTIAFDYAMDYELLEYAIRDANFWSQVRHVVALKPVRSITGTRVGELAAEVCYRELSGRGLSRHHALADALALRAAYIAVSGESEA